MRAKYVITSHYGIEAPIVFSELFNHSNFKVIGEIVGAGFVSISDNKFHCFGRSITLKSASREKDSEILNRHFQLLEEQ